MVRTLLCLIAVTLLAAQPHAQSAQSSSASREAASVSELVNLNSATLAELQKLPGIGAKTAERIVEYRQKKGPFKKIEELMNVQGIGEKSFLKLRSQITVTSVVETATSR